MNKRLVVLLSISLLFCAGSHAQSYPVKPIRIIVPLAAGGSLDQAGRMLAEKMTPSLGQSVYVENRSGASTDIGVGTLARSVPDGYTIGMVPVGSVATGTLVRKLPYDPIKDLAPISGVSKSGLVIVTSGSSPYRNMADVIADAKKRPGEVSFGSAGIGSSHHLAGELLRMMANIDLLHVPYKGSSEANVAVVAGQISLAVSGAAGSTTLMRSGKLRALATTDGKRIPGLPDIPTVGETVPGYSGGAGGLSIFAPGGTPVDIINRLNAEVVRILKLPDVLECLAKNGEDPDPTTPAELGGLLRAEIEKWTNLVKTTGLKLQ